MKEYNDTKIEEKIIIDMLKESTIRLTKEIVFLKHKATLDFTIGFMLATIGIIVLFFHAMSVGLSFEKDDNFFKYLLHFLPTFSFSLFCEFFAFVFIRLYKHLLEDIKFYQNEISNFELKTFASLTALAANDSLLLKPIIKQLASAERNFILNKGETTIGLEQDKLNRNDIIDLVREIISMPNRNKK